ncbi:C40 family peptidase [Geobacter pelophilus]|uniref:C40 family peptidase n=1 Tax=Geoanaerobacter pelophilus TaxID=60036 RepID=A0AAW4KYD5_9BACT|nr:NlpC/P60 family protein [Geoanaerobacter pelophilus]MBT0662927.1 C40 family peptidase [Geoanaerobacter pelophilus]
MNYFQLQAIATALVLMLATPGCATSSKGGLSKQQGITRIGYAIQVGAFREVKNAERLAARLQEKGVEAFYFRKEDGVYAVRFGDFRTRDSARQAAVKLQKEKLLTSYFIASPLEPVLKKGYPAEVKKPVEQGAVKKQTAAGSDMGGIAARTAERFVGIPYRWGGDTVVDGMDCSGFVRAVYNLCGVNIPRTSREQYRVGESVAIDGLKDGDLVFFGDSEERINHVGIYVGDRKFVHAPRRGDEIKVSALDEAYFAKRFIGGKRYF